MSVMFSQCALTLKQHQDSMTGRKTSAMRVHASHDLKLKQESKRGSVHVTFDWMRSLFARLDAQDSFGALLYLELREFRVEAWQICTKSAAPQECQSTRLFCSCASFCACNTAPPVFALNNRVLSNARHVRAFIAPFAGFWAFSISSNL